MQESKLNPAFLYMLHTILTNNEEINELVEQVSFKKKVDFMSEVCIIKIEKVGKNRNILAVNPITIIKERG